MPKVEAWECKHTGALFPLANENEYKKHTRRAYRSIVAQKKLEKEKAEFDEWLVTEKAKCKTLKQVSLFLEKNFDKLNTYRFQRTTRKPTIVEVTISGDFRACASNTHSCPHNGVTNWRCKEDLPKGYPAIVGRINIEVEKDNYTGFLSDYFGPAQVYTGSGGGGNYELTLWLDDWPGLKETVEKQIAEYNEQHVVNILADRKSPIFRVKWED